MKSKPILVLFSALVAAWPSQAQTTRPQPLRIAVSTATPHNTPLWVAKVEDAEDFYLEALEELDRKPYPTLEGTRIVIKYVGERNPKVASLKADEIIDSSWLKNLDNEGFFEKVYGGK